MSQSIPLFHAGVLGEEEAYVAEVIASGKLGGGDGPFGTRCEALLQDLLGVPRVLLTPSCTAALEMAALLLNLNPGDEVIMPSFTFVSTDNAFCLRGAVPRFVDIREDTLNFDERLVETAVNERTRAIVPVHYGGVACDMDAITDIAARHGLVVIEDAAQAIGAGHRDRPLGAIGALGGISFHESKNLGCGEGGALVIRDPVYIDTAEILRDKGTDRRAFMDGRVDKYTWRGIGSSYQISELNAAFLFGQLEHVQSATDARWVLHARYSQGLRPLVERGLVRHQTVPQDRQGNAHIMSLICADPRTRDDLIGHLRGRGIGATFHFVPLHTAPMGLGFGYSAGMLPVTEAVSAALLRLPLFNGMTEDQVDTVVAAVLDFYGA